MPIDKSEFEAIAIYNADEQKLVGIFGSYVAAELFVWGERKNAIGNVVRRKYKTKSELLGFKIAARAANKSQIEKLDGSPYWIIPPLDTPEVISLIKRVLGKSYGEINPYKPHFSPSKLKAPQIAVIKELLKSPTLELIEQVAEQFNIKPKTAKFYAGRDLPRLLKGFTDQELLQELGRRESAKN